MELSLSYFYCSSSIVTPIPKFKAPSQLRCNTPFQLAFLSKRCLHLTSYFRCTRIRHLQLSLIPVSIYICPRSFLVANPSSALLLKLNLKTLRICIHCVEATVKRQCQISDRRQTHVASSKFWGQVLRKLVCECHWLSKQRTST